MKQKMCVICKEMFCPRASFQKTCAPECAIAYVNLRKAKLEKQKQAKEASLTRQQLINLKPLKYWIDKAQKAVNDYVRERDRDLPCISCGRHHKGQYHAGHYLSTKANPELRFDTSNIHKQCYVCNVELSGNISNYRKNLLEKIGLDELERLEGPHDTARYRKDDLIEIEEEYKRLKKNLTAGKS